MNREQILSFEKDTRTIKGFFNTTEVQDIVLKNKKDSKHFCLFLLFLASFLIILFNFDLLPSFVLNLMILSTPFLPVILIFSIGPCYQTFIQIYQLQDLFKNKYGIRLNKKDIKIELNDYEGKKIYFYDVDGKKSFIDTFELSNKIMLDVLYTENYKIALLFFSERYIHSSKTQKTIIEQNILKFEKYIKENEIVTEDMNALFSDFYKKFSEYKLNLSQQIEKYNNYNLKQEIY